MEFWLYIAAITLFCWVLVDKGYKGALVCSGILALLFLFVKHGGVQW